MLRIFLSRQPFLMQIFFSQLDHICCCLFKLLFNSSPHFFTSFTKPAGIPTDSCENSTAAEIGFNSSPVPNGYPNPIPAHQAILAAARGDTNQRHPNPLNRARESRRARLQAELIRPPEGQECPKLIDRVRSVGENEEIPVDCFCGECN